MIPAPAIVARMSPGLRLANQAFSDRCAQHDRPLLGCAQGVGIRNRARGRAPQLSSALSLREGLVRNKEPAPPRDSRGALSSGQLKANTVTESVRAGSSEA